MVKWGVLTTHWSIVPMPSTRSSKQKKSSKKAQKSPSQNEGVIQRKLRSSRPRRCLKEIDSIKSSVDIDVGTNHDAEIPATVVDESVDGDVESSSIVSGPTLSYLGSPVKLTPSESLCSACRKLHQKAKKMKAPIKDKLLDNDPTSLTCDQWVLLKKWRPRRLCNARGKLSIHVQRVKKRLGLKQSEWCVGESESSACSRPHVFLQRNLRKCVRVPGKQGRKKTRRKRAREEDLGSHVAKQQRLRSNRLHQYNNTNGTNESGLYPASSYCSSPSFEGCSQQEICDQTDRDLTIELIPTAVTMETTKKDKVLSRQKVSKPTGGFRDLLTQLRGNNSMIIRETH
ncbi:hypothetical protein LDENG_00272710 [Lucifuga dentata]|nr:hypothetical protein LDENG_00272710 [Lucifuga dentata]